ncbi:MAG: hypothetical protein V1750_06860 [Acidobacteriota bacterium]
MAGAVQWSIDQLYSGLQQIYNQIKSIESSLNTDKAELTKLYAFARAEYDPAGAYDRALLDPLIHRNSVLRLSYLKPIKDKYAQAVSLASKALKSAGYTTPGLSGLGAAFVIAPAAAVVLVVAALAAVATVALLTQAQRNRTAALKAVIGNEDSTPAEKTAMLAAMKDAINAESKVPGPLGSFDWLVPAIGLVAVIVLGPSVLKMISSRRAAA